MNVHADPAADATALEPDVEQIRTFVDALFRHADAGSFISFRAFDDERSDMPALFTVGVSVGDKELVPLALEYARQAATHPRPHVFCPPVATFSNARKADLDVLANGVAISVECDARPNASRAALAEILGVPTVVVASGGEWLDAETGEIEPKLHLHWRLAIPTRTPAEHALLREARALATRLVGADATSIAINHPMRWPGTWHRKAEPRLATIVACCDREVDLRDAIADLRQAAGSTASETPRGRFSDAFAKSRLKADHLLDIVAALAVIPNENLPWDEWNRIGMAAWLASEGTGFVAFDAWSQQSDKYDAQTTRDRWAHFSKSPPDRIGAGTLFYLAAEAHPGWTKPSAQKSTASAGAGAAGLFDPWQRFVVPDFPFDVLPADVAEFVETQAIAIGCDPSGVAMSVLATLSAALDHRFSLRLMRHGVFSASPRLWVLLVGDPSYKKTPMQNAALRPLEAHQNRLRDEYERAVDEHLKAGGKPETGPPHPPRFIVGDTTVEKLGEIAARYDRGLLVRRDELAGWIGSMEKYSGGKGGAVDRAFWLQSFDGGSFTVDRVTRGEFRVRNLSVSMLGGIQPARLAEMHGLTSDGLLQRFIPVMLKAPSFREDVETDASSLVYAQRVLECVNARPENLRLTDGAVEAMRDLHRYLHDLEQTASGVTAGFQGFIGKLAGLSGSIAILLHMIGDPRRAAFQEVTAGTVEKAHAVVRDFVLPHALEFYRTSEATTNGDRLQRICSYILTAGKSRIVQSDLTTNVASFRGLSVSEVNERLSPLVAGGWLTQEKPGPVANAWVVSPDVAAQFAERSREEAARKAAMADLMQSPRRRRAA